MEEALTIAVEFVMCPLYERTVALKEQLQAIPARHGRSAASVYPDDLTGESLVPIVPSNHD